jgi:hypothetical protein
MPASAIPLPTAAPLSRQSPRAPQDNLTYQVTLLRIRTETYTPNAGNATSVPGTAVQLFNGGPNSQESMDAPVVNASNGNVTLTWSSVEGGTYKVEASNTMTGSWTTLNAAKPADAGSTRTTTLESGAALASPKRFYRVTRTGLNTYDP